MSALTRRSLFAGLGGLTAAAAGAAIASAAPVATADTPRPSAVTYGPLQTLTLGAIDFHLRGGENPYTYIDPGGVAMLYGSGMFGAGVQLPVGALLANATLYLNPNSHQTTFSIKRYRSLSNQGQTLRTRNSTTGTGIEAINLTLNHVIAAAWNYRFDDILMSAGGAVLYGGRLQYQLPA